MVQSLVRVSVEVVERLAKIHEFLAIHGAILLLLTGAHLEMELLLQTVVFLVGFQLPMVVQPRLAALFLVVFALCVLHVCLFVIVLPVSELLRVLGPPLSGLVIVVLVLALSGLLVFVLARDLLLQVDLGLRLLLCGDTLEEPRLKALTRQDRLPVLQPLVYLVVNFVRSPVESGSIGADESPSLLLFPLALADQEVQVAIERQRLLLVFSTWGSVCFLTSLIVVDQR